MDVKAYTSRKQDVESLPHLKPFLWGGFSPKLGREYDEMSCKRLVGGYVNRIAGMSGAHLYPLFVVYPDNTKVFRPNLHAHFIILSDRPIGSEKYRAARQRTHGIFHVKRYKVDLDGVDYMYSKHEEMRYDDIYCRNGRRCRQKHIHREFHDGLHSMWSRWSV